MAEKNGEPSEASGDPEVAAQLVVQTLDNGEVRVSAPEEEGAALQMVEAARLHIYERRILRHVRMMLSGKGPDGLVRPGKDALDMFGGPGGRA